MAPCWGCGFGFRATLPQVGRRARIRCRFGARRDPPVCLSKAAPSQSRCQGGFSIRRRGSAGGQSPGRSEGHRGGDPSGGAGRSRSHLPRRRGRLYKWVKVQVVGCGCWLRGRLLVAGRRLRWALLPGHLCPSVCGPGSALGLRPAPSSPPRRSALALAELSPARSLEVRDVARRPTRRCSWRPRGATLPGERS
jgi:hypothetical protein